MSIEKHQTAAGRNLPPDSFPAAPAGPRPRRLTRRGRGQPVMPALVIAAGAGAVTLTTAVALTGCTGSTSGQDAHPSVTVGPSSHMAKPAMPSSSASAKPAFKPPMAHPARANGHRRHATSGGS